MGLPLLYSAPSSDRDWQGWSFNHAANHYDILAAISAQKDQNLAQYILDPMDQNNLDTWLYQHQVMHSQANAVLGTKGYDLLGLDWNDPGQFQLWLRQNGDEHLRLCTALGVG